MNNILKQSTFLLLITFFSFFTSNAQTKPKQGVIKSTTDVSGISDPTTAAMFKDNKTILTFKDDKSRIDMIGAVFQMSVIRSEDDKTTMLIDMMGQKYKTDFTKEMQEAKVMKDNSYDVQVTDETKVIAGYNCKKAIIKTKDGQTYDVFYTEDIVSGLDKSFPYQKIKGFPMEYQKDAKGMKIKYVVTSVDLTSAVSDDIFKIPSGYSEMPESMSKQFGK